MPARAAAATIGAMHAYALASDPGRGLLSPPEADTTGPGPLWSMLDDPAEWPAFGRALPDGRWESQLAVEGMHCAACAFTVEAALRAVPGVERAEVNAASRRARVVWSPSLARPSRWLSALEGTGYRLLPALDAPQRERRQRDARMALWRWLVAGLCMMQVMMYAVPAYVAGPGEMSADMARLLRWASWVLTLPVMLFCCTPFFRQAWRDLRHARLGMDLPVALGMAIAFAVSSAATFDPDGPLGREVYFDSLTMFVFFLLSGRWLEARLRERTAGALEALMQRLPDSAERLRADGSFERVPLRRLAADDIVRVRPGEAFPADGVLLDGETSVDEALLTGEATPVLRRAGEPVHAGSHNLGAPVRVVVRACGPDTRYAGIVALMDQAALGRPRLARLADRAARPFLLAVLLAAGAAAAWWWPRDPAQALMVAVSVLIVTCPCALSLATPAAMLASAGALARRGVLVRELQALERLAAVDTLVFDKTGTLTRPLPRLERIYSRSGVPPGDALERAAALGQGSLHPVARALAQAWESSHRCAMPWQVLGQREVAGQGTEARLRRPFRREGGHAGPAHATRLGSAAFCGVAPLHWDGVQAHLSDGDGWLASFAFVEDLRSDAAASVDALRGQGVGVRLLSGDRPDAARRVAQEAGIAEARGGCSPEDKLAALATLQSAGRRVAMVGDGLNDGPAIARADASFAFGEAVPLARARADFVVLGDALQAVPFAIAQSRRTLRVVRQNLAWAAAYNALCVPLAIVGWLPAWLAGLGMAASSLLVVANAARLSRPAPAGAQGGG